MSFIPKKGTWCVVLGLFVVWQAEQYGHAFHLNAPIQISDAQTRNAKHICEYCATVHCRTSRSLSQRSAVTFDLSETTTQKDEAKPPNFEKLQAFSQSVTYAAAEATYLISLTSLFYAGYFSSVLSPETSSLCQSACHAVALLHIIFSLVSYYVALMKGLEPSSSVTSTLLTGGMGFFRVVLLDDKETKEAKKAAKNPPLRMEINTLAMKEKGYSAAAVLQTMSIKVKEGQQHIMAKKLEQLVENSTNEYGKLLLSMAANQDGEERTNFLVLQRFPSFKAMSVYQNTETFKQFAQEAETLLDGPIGLYIVNERNGVFSEPCYPFGPAGEGGRDDAIYSSPVNLDWSQKGAEVVRTS